MAAYAVIMLAVAAVFLILGVAVYRGNTRLIMDYHQERVKESERRDYGRAFAKGLFTLCAAMAASGALALFGGDGALAKASVAVLVAGLVLSLAILWRVQKKYNGGIF